jgi:hypothetical protein
MTCCEQAGFKPSNMKKTLAPAPQNPPDLSMLSVTGKAFRTEI